MNNLIHSSLRLGLDNHGKPCYNEYIKTKGRTEMFDSNIVQDAISELQQVVDTQENMDSELTTKMDEIEEAKNELESAVEDIAGVLEMLQNLDTSRLEEALESARYLTD